jgi:hypothetical protein
LFGAEVKPKGYMAEFPLFHGDGKPSNRQLIKSISP